MQTDGEMPAALELRFAELEIRAGETGDGLPARLIRGLAAPYQAKTTIRSYGGGEFEEWLEPGVFGETLRSGADVRLLLEHDHRSLLARTRAGNLRLQDTPHGLQFEAELPDTQAARDVLEHIKVRNYAGMSFGFRPVEMQRTYGANGRLATVAHRAAALHEISIVSAPAYARTSVALRSVLLAPAAPVPAEVLAMRLRLARARG